MRQLFSFFQRKQLHSYLAQTTKGTRNIVFYHDVLSTPPSGFYVHVSGLKPLSLKLCKNGDTIAHCSLHDDEDVIEQLIICKRERNYYELIYSFFKKAVNTYHKGVKKELSSATLQNIKNRLSSMFEVLEQKIQEPKDENTPLIQRIEAPVPKPVLLYRKVLEPKLTRLQIEATSCINGYAHLSKTESHRLTQTYVKAPEELLNAFCDASPDAQDEQYPSILQILTSLEELLEKEKEDLAQKAS